MRGRKARSHICREILELCTVIHDVGTYNAKKRDPDDDDDDTGEDDGTIIVSFGELFQVRAVYLWKGEKKSIHVFRVKFSSPRQLSIILIKSFRSFGLFLVSDLHKNIGQSGGFVDRGQTTWFRVLRSRNIVPSEYLNIWTLHVFTMYENRGSSRY